MSLILGALGMGRAHAQARMTETFQFFTIADDDDTLNSTPVETEIGRTVGRLKTVNAQGMDVESANQFPVVERLEIHIPSTPYSPVAPSPWLFPSEGLYPAIVVPVGCFARCIDSSADISLVGREFRVTGRPKAGQTTAHRYSVEEVS